ncbi:hypothetical protein [Streptomyces sp. NPDC047028]|uniref:SCO4402 family protein n=1 Tax=Streptomyces sp. NPDC047028 TaxID=3155793 RepID=UPI0033F4F8D6
MEFSKLSKVSFPEMRESVISAVSALTDEKYQKEVWVDQNYPEEGYFDDFELNIHILFDDTLVLEDPASALGTILRSTEEVNAMEKLASAINDLLASEGSDKTDIQYITSPLWGAVVRSASIALGILNQ